MRELTVAFDARCGLCCAISDWVGRQAQLVPLAWRPAEGPAQEELTVTADTGEYWTGDAAFLMVLWALAEYRHWAYRLATPALRPTARSVFATLSSYRGTLSCALGLPAHTEGARGNSVR